VRGADPADWYGLGELTDERPLVDDGEPVRVSPSRLEAFRRCPLRWMLESSGGTTSSSTSQGLGTLVHALAQQAADEGLDADDLQARLAIAIERVDLGSGWFAIRQRERATEMVRKLAVWMRTNPRAFVAAELAFKVTVGRAVLKGQVDRLETDANGRLVVVDLKTGKGQPKRDELPSNAQLGAYQLAVEQGAFVDVPGGGQIAGGAELVQLGTGTQNATTQRQDALSDSADPRWALDMVEQSAEGMAGQIFAAIANDMCRSCPVRTSCPLHDDGRQVTA
jgi:RecB family exonuclease